MKSALTGKVALVAGATRGAGRAIAVSLGEAGATVYCTGRSTRAQPRQKSKTGDPFHLAHRPETIEETAEMVDARGGRGISVRVDHTEVPAVEALIRRIEKEQGRLDIVVNDIWGGDELSEWVGGFWNLSLKKGMTLIERAVHTHIITSRFAAPLLIKGQGGLIVEVTDGAAYHYRGSLFYDLAKMMVIRLAFDMAEELREHGVTALAVSPGFLRSEAMLEHFGVSEADWRQAGEQNADFLASETPYYVGRAVVALASDPGVSAKSGRTFGSWDLQHEYGFADIDGSRPDWGRYAAGKDFGAAQQASHERFLRACAGDIDRE